MLNHLEMERYVSATAKRADLRVQWEEIEAPRTSGSTVYLPKMGAEITETGYKRLRHFVTHEVDHHLYTDFHNPTQAKGVNAQTSLLGAIWNLTEDHRIEFLGTREYEGDRLASNDVYPDMLLQLDEGLRSNPNPDLADTFLPLATWANKAWSDYYPSAHLVQDKLESKMSPKAKSYYDKLNKGDYLDVLRNIREIEDKKEGTQATLELSRRIFEEVFDGDSKKEEQRCEQEQKKSGSGEGEGEPGEGKKAKGKAGNGKAEEGEGKRDDSEGPPINVDYTSVIREPHVDDPGITRRGLHYNYEKFMGTNHYTPPTPNDYRVEDMSVKPARSGSSEDYYGPSIKSALASTSSGFAHRVRTILQIRDRDKYQYGVKRGKLHNSALHRVLVKDVPGYNERIFKRRQVNSVLDAAVTLIVDQSGSMGNQKYSHAAAAAIMLSDTVGNVLHIPTEIVSFSTSGSTKSAIYIHRKFSDKLVDSDALLHRFCASASHGMSSNGDGEAVLWAFDRIIQRKEKRKLIVVFSDGQPAFGARGDDMYYAKKIVKEIENDTPVDIVGIGIMDENVTLIYKEHQVIWKAHELEAALLNLIENKLK